MNRTRSDDWGLPMFGLASKALVRRSFGRILEKLTSWLDRTRLGTLRL
jgi:hypothetical protein